MLIPRTMPRSAEAGCELRQFQTISRVNFVTRQGRQSAAKSLQ
jgi:hypothetical protein